MIRFAAILLALVVAFPANAKNTISGPLEARVLRVIDGDTIEVAARVWLDLMVTTRVRLVGIDTPEIKGKCQREKDLARAARQFTERLAGKVVYLRRVTYDKYAGRVLAEVMTVTGDDIGKALILEGVARPYDGGKRQGWCP